MKLYLNIIMVLIGMLFNIACGVGPRHSNVFNVEPQYQLILQTFENESNARGIMVNSNDLIIVSVNSLPNSLPGAETLGMCYRGSNQTPEIHVNSTYWNSGITDLDREELLFHELGHCLLNLEHTTVTEQVQGNGFTGVLPISIMNPIHIYYGLYSDNRTEYLNQLFYFNYIPKLRY